MIFHQLCTHQTEYDNLDLLGDQYQEVNEVNTQDSVYQTLVLKDENIYQIPSKIVKSVKPEDNAAKRSSSLNTIDKIKLTY